MRKKVVLVVAALFACAAFMSCSKGIETKLQPPEATYPGATAIVGQAHSEGQSFEYRNELTGICLTFPASWADKYKIDTIERYISVCEINNAQAGYGGTLFSLTVLPSSQKESIPFPKYEILSENNGTLLIVYYPTDLQYNNEEQELADVYNALATDIPSVVATAHFG